MKKFIGIALASTMALSSMAAIAEGDRKVYVNGSALDATYIENNGTKFIPLREVCEELGFTVNWDGEARRIEVVNLPVYITLTPDEDGYTFSKMAPQKLGSAPILKDGTTYVPTGFVDEILGGTIVNDEDITINYGNPSAVVSVKEKREDSLLVEDKERGEVIVNITEDTIIFNKEGKEIAFKDLDTKKALDITYGEAMTMSIPAITNAVKICETEETAKNPVGEATVIEKKDNTLLVNLEGQGEVVLNITPETEFFNADGKKIDYKSLDIKKTLVVTYGEAMTLSLPPITNAVKIEEAKEEEKTDSSVGKATLIEKTEDQIKVYLEGKGAVVINVNEDTAIVDADGKKVAFKALDNKNVLEITYSNAMTFSIPPIANGYKIVVTKEKASENPTGRTLKVLEKKDDQLRVVLDTIGEVVVNVTDETVLLNAKGEKVSFKDLNTENGLEITYSNAMTRSLPPMTNAIKIAELA